MTLKNVETPQAKQIRKSLEERRPPTPEQIAVRSRIEAKKSLEDLRREYPSFDDEDDATDAQLVLSREAKQRLAEWKTIELSEENEALRRALQDYQSAVATRESQCRPKRPPRPSRSVGLAPWEKLEERPGAKTRKPSGKVRDRSPHGSTRGQDFPTHHFDQSRIEELMARSRAEAEQSQSQGYHEHSARTQNQSANRRDFAQTPAALKGRRGGPGEVVLHKGNRRSRK